MNRPARRRSSYRKISEVDDCQQKQQQQSPQHLHHQQPTTTTILVTNNNDDDNKTTMDGANRKIELQSPEDLTYLINNVRRGAAEHIHAAFPPVEDDQEEDELRVRIEKIVDEVRFPFF